MSTVVIPSIRGGIVERYLPGDRYTAKVLAGQAATGGRLVEAATGDRIVRTAQVGSMLCVGVALHDAAALAAVTVATTGVWLLRASANIAAGQRVVCAAAGEVAPLAAETFGALIGWAMADITAGADGPIRLNL